MDISSRTAHRVGVFTRTLSLACAVLITFAGVTSFAWAQISSDRTKHSAVLNDSAVSSEQKAEFFRKAFGFDIPEVWYSEPLLIIVNQQATQTLDAQINPYSLDVRIKGDVLLEMIKSYIKPDVAFDALDYIAPSGYADIEALKGVGFQFRLNRLRYTYSIQVPLSISRRLDLYAAGTGLQNRRRTRPHTPVSGYINAFSYHGFNRDANGERIYGGQTRLESNLNIGNWVFQHQGSYTDSEQSRYWRNAAARAVYMQPELAQHVILGEQTPFNTDWRLQPTPLGGAFDERLVGVGVNKRASLSDFSMVSNSFQYDFNLAQGAEVQVFINDELAYQRRLESGAYSLKDLPLTQGFNDIRVVIYKDDGQVEDFEDTYYQSATLLSSQEQEWQIAAGYLYETNFDLSDLDHENPVLYGFYRYGYSEKLTIGPYFHYQNARKIGGLMMQFGSALGPVTVDVSRSHDEIIGGGNAMRLELIGNPTYAPFGFFEESYQNFGLIAEAYESEYVSFGRVGEGAQLINPIKWIINPTLEVGFGPNTRFSLGGVYRKIREEGEDTPSRRSVDMRLVHRWRHFDFGLQFRRNTQDVEVTDNNQLLFFVTYNGQAGRRFARAEYNTSTQERSLVGTYRPEFNRYMRYEADFRQFDADNFDHSVGVSYRDGYVNRSLILERRTNNGEQQRGVSATWENARGALRGRLTGFGEGAETGFIGVESALVFAGDKVAISAPINDSFAIVYPSQALKESVVTFRNRAQIDRWGPAVISDLNSYQNTRISIQQSDTPVGADLGTGSYYVNPPYGSGTLIKLGEGGTILLTGSLLDESGEPYRLATGQVISLEEEHLDKVKFFFTGQSGGFTVSGLEAGRYQIVINNDKYLPINIELNPETNNSGIIQAGSLKLVPNTNED